MLTIGGRPYDLSSRPTIVFNEKNIDCIDCTYKGSGKMTGKILCKVSFSMGPIFFYSPLRNRITAPTWIVR